VSENICVIPGTFDPVTNGHLDVILRASKIFDKIYIASFDHSAGFDHSVKKTMFSSDDRREMLKLACKDLIDSGKVIIDTIDETSELLVDYAQSKKAGFVVRGVRNIGDYEYEYSLSLIYRKIGNNIDTVIFPAKSEHLYISSTFVREMILYKRDVSEYVPEKVNQYIKSII